MPIRKLRSKVTAGNETLATPTLLRGSNLDQFASTENLGLVELSAAIGMNTSAMYQLKNKDLPLKTPLAILLRLYAAFPETIPRMWTPSFTEFYNLIRKAVPDFQEYSVGPLLGIDKNSIYRIRQEGFDECKDATKILVLLIYRLLTEDLKNWSVIKEIVELEAKARNLDPELIWKKGSWNSSDKKKTATKQAPKPEATKEQATIPITWTT